MTLVVYGLGMTEKRVRNAEALEGAATILARLVEAEAHQLARAVADGQAPRASPQIETIAKAGRAVAALMQTLDRVAPSAAETMEHEGMNDDPDDFDALPIERKRAEIHRILDRLLERGGPTAGRDAGRGMDEPPSGALVDPGEGRAEAA